MFCDLHNMRSCSRTICPTIRRLDEHRKRAKCLADLFGNEEANAWRKELIEKCEAVMFDDQDSVNTKPREILWRKGYYDTIAMAKRFIHTQLKHTALADLDGIYDLGEFIEAGMARLKKIIVRLESDYNLDLRCLVDFTLFGEVNAVVEPGDIPINKKITSLEIINFALESIHALIVSLGDLHRYYLDFGLNTLINAGITRQLADLYYKEAFKLNPQNGMPQNQLGTLWIGRGYNLDSVYFYLHSLVCPRPFELSEDNVIRLFQQNSAYLETIKMDEDYQVTLRDFIGRFLLIVDIFFFDKNVPTFNELCSFLLCDLNVMLQRKESSGLDQEMLFKMTALLFFCMRKLKKSNSPKLYYLNAFLAGICDQFVDNCNTRFEDFFKGHEKENQEYQLKYAEAYSAYQKLIQDECGRGIPREAEQPVENGNRHLSSNSGVSPDAYGGSSGEISTNEKANYTRNGKAAGSAAKKAVKYRRRRRRSTVSSASESDLTSNFDSESSEESSDEEEDQKSDEEGRNVKDQQAIRHFNGDDDSDIVIEEETVVIKTKELYGNTIQSPVPSSVDVVNGMQNAFADMHFREDATDGENKGSGRLRMRKKIFFPLYDPNLVLKFATGEPTIPALKVLFDWLMGNKDILWECYQSNPQFVDKIMSLLNVVTLNICTRKVFFHRALLTTDGLREDIQSLFDVRSKMPIAEDLLLKHFGEFVEAQANLDWEMPAQLKVTASEVDLLRLFKLKNFGFFIADRRKFGYAFLNCRFERTSVEQDKKRINSKKAAKQGSRRSELKGRNEWKSSSSGEGKGSDGKRIQKLRKAGTEKKRGRRNRAGASNKNMGNPPGPGKVCLLEAGDGDLKAKDKGLREKEMLQKGELMKKLWLRNEVKTLESQVNLLSFFSFPCYALHMFLVDSRTKGSRIDYPLCGGRCQSSRRPFGHCEAVGAHGKANCFDSFRR